MPAITVPSITITTPRGLRRLYATLAIASLGLAIEQRIDLVVPATINYTDGITRVVLQSMEDWPTSIAILAVAISLLLLGASRCRGQRLAAFVVACIGVLLGLLAVAGWSTGELLFADQLRNQTLLGVPLFANSTSTLFLDSPSRWWHESPVLIRLRLDPTFSVALLVYLGVLVGAIAYIMCWLTSDADPTRCACGYDTRSLRKTGVCPECGSPLAVRAPTPSARSGTDSSA